MFNRLLRSFKIIVLTVLFMHFMFYIVVISINGEYLNWSITQDFGCYSNEILPALNSIEVNKFSTPRSIKSKSYMSFKHFKPSTRNLIKIPNVLNFSERNYT